MSDALSAFSAYWGAETPERAVAQAVEDTISAFRRVTPVDPRAVADKFGATVKIMPGSRDAGGNLIDHGSLAVRESAWHIRVPSELSSERRRFSIAHEIGHILLFSAVADNPEHVRELRSDALHARVERLCNTAAAQILMPAQSFTFALEELGELSRSSIDELARRFWVSREAAMRRVTEVHPNWGIMFWELSRDHPRGVAWRTSKTQNRGTATFLPPGLSSSRLHPDVVEIAATAGEAFADEVRPDIPGMTAMYHVSAWKVEVRRNELVGLERATPTPDEGRIYVLYHTKSPRA